MSKRSHVIRFVMPSAGAGTVEEPGHLIPERALRATNAATWVGLTVVLWSLLAAPLLVW